MGILQILQQKVAIANEPDLTSSNFDGMFAPPTLTSVCGFIIVNTSLLSSAGVRNIRYTLPNSMGLATVNTRETFFIKIFTHLETAGK